MKAVEGGMVEADGVFFDVRGVVHPPGKVIVSLHFLPDPKGDRKKGGATYSRASSFSESQRLLEENFPEYIVNDPVFGERLCELPAGGIDRLYSPINRLRELRTQAQLDEVEEQALSFIELLRESSNVPWRGLGVSGSILVKLHLPSSDIDPVVYGSKNCRKAYAALKSMMESEGPVKPHDIEGLKRLYEFRSRDTIMPFRYFVRTESRKVLQGKYLGRDYSIKLVKDRGEIKEKYGSIRYSPVGYAKIRAKITDDSEAIFTPCRYSIEGARVIEGTNVGPIQEIVSFRMRFCEQARRGEEVITMGKVERILGEGRREGYRLIVGGKITDFMMRQPHR